MLRTLAVAFMLGLSAPAAGQQSDPAALQDWYLTAGQALGQPERLSRKMSWYDWDRGDRTMADIVALAEGSRFAADGYGTQETRRDREEGAAALQGRAAQR